MEIWKEIDWLNIGGKTSYYISNKGNVKSIRHTATKGDIERILAKNKKGSCSSVSISVINGAGKAACKQHSVPKLVATAFIPNPNDYPFVCHRHDIYNDEVDNLLWGRIADRCPENRKVYGDIRRHSAIVLVTGISTITKGFTSMAAAYRLLKISTSYVAFRESIIIGNARHIDSSNRNCRIIRVMYDSAAEVLDINKEYEDYVTKYCPHCGKYKSLTSFNLSPGGEIRVECNRCRGEI